MVTMPSPRDLVQVVKGRDGFMGDPSSSLSKNRIVIKKWLSGLYFLVLVILLFRYEILFSTLVRDYSRVIKPRPELVNSHS